MTHTLKGILIFFAAAIIASTTLAFASANTFVPGNKGEGAGGISGYTVTNIAYQYNADPSKIDSVVFTLDTLAVTVKIKLNDSVSSWYSCSHLTGNDWSCQTNGATVQAADTLRVFAAGN